MSSPSKRRVSCLASIMVIIGATPCAMFAQTITKVRVAASATKSAAENACTAKTPEPIDDKPGQPLIKDSHVRIEVQDDRNQLAKSANDLAIRLDNVQGSIAKDSSVTTITGDFGGKLLTIVQGANNTMVCVISLPSAKTPADTAERSVRVGIGASFDFLNGVSPTDLYSDLTVTLPTLWNATRKDKTSRRWAFGIDAGLYNGRTVPRRDSTITDASETTARSRTLPRKSPNDSIMRIVQIVQRTRSESVDRLGVYLAPTFRLADGLFVLVQSELVRRDVVTEIKEKVVSQDTITQAPRTTAPIEGTGPAIGDTTLKTRYSEYKAIHTAGVLMSMRAGNIEFRVKPTFGFIFDNEPGARRHTRGIYTAQFRVTDFEHGFKIGGDVRGLANGDETAFLVYLAKDFGFKRLGSFILGSGEK